MDKNISDNDLLMALKAGDKTAFNALYDRYWSVLFRLAFRILERHDASKDVVQEVFVSFFEKHSKRDISNVKAYLLQSTKYQCFMQLRAGKLTAKHIERMENVITCNLVDEEIEADELQKAIDHQIASLPEKCREVFELSRVEELTNKKIAERLNISQKTVENQITKALRTLRLTVDKLAFLAFSLLF
jgi:RNA polymerase sigma-70 factor (family 1)